MPVKQEQIVTPEDDILTRYYMNKMSVTGNAPTSLMYGVEPTQGIGPFASGDQYAAALSSQKSGYDENAGKFGTYAVAENGDIYAVNPRGNLDEQDYAAAKKYASSMPKTQTKKEDTSDKKTTEKKQESKKPVYAIAENMGQGSYSGTGEIKGLSLTGDKEYKGYGLSDDGSSLSSQQKLQAAQVAFDAAGSDDIAGAKNIISDEKKTADVQQKDPNEMSMPEKLAMIAMAVAPVIAGYALYGEKGAYIGGAAGMKGVGKTADIMVNQESQQKAQESKERIAAQKKGAAGSTATIEGLNAQGEPEVFQKSVDPKTGKLGFIPTGLRPVPQVGVDSLGNPMVKTPAQVAQTYQKPTAAPSGVATSLPKETKTTTIGSLGKRWQDLQTKLGLPPEAHPFFEQYGNLSYSAASKPIIDEETGKMELPSQTKNRIETLEFLNKRIGQMEQRLSGNINKDMTSAEAFERRKEFEEVKDKLRRATGLEFISARGEQARKTAGFKSTLSGVVASKDEKVLRDNAKKYAEDTKNVYTKLVNVDSFKNANDAPSIAALFNSYMKLVQQDESVVRDTDVQLVQKFMPWLDNIEGYTERIKNNPGMAQKVKNELIAAAKQLGESRAILQIKMNDATYKKAKELKADPRKVVDQGVEAIMIDFVENKVPIVTSTNQLSSIPPGKMYRINGQGNVVFVSKGGTSAVPYQYKP